MSETPWHYIRPNHASRYPRRIVCFDTEAKITETKQYERQRFRLAAASFDRFQGGYDEPIETKRTVEFEPNSLWEWITAGCKGKSRTVVFAHNLAYDLRLSNAMAILHGLGWSLSFLAIDSARCVLRYRKNGASLILTDLSSYLPASLEKVAADLNMTKAPLPTNISPEGDWVRRCVTDVEITREAVLRILRWLEANDMGSFRLTGPAQAMAAYRHRFLPRQGLLVHKEPEALQAERTAAWAGRCEAFRHGRISEPLYEWDFRLAYLHAARDLRLPVQLRGKVKIPSVAELRRLSSHRAILASVTMETDLPTVPARTPEGIVWPVGRFDTVLWDRELLAAVQRGARVEIREAWAYYTWPALTEWGDWLLAQLAPDGLPATALERRMLKHWARCLIGRFGARWPVWDKVATLPDSKIELLPFVDADTGEEGAYLQNGDEWFERSGYVEATDAMPAIMGYVMAEARIRLLKAIEAAGWENVYYCDTDSLIVNGIGDENIAHPVTNTGFLNLIRKGEYSSATIYGPRQLRLDSDLRVAGLPKKAVQRSERSFEAQLWESFSESIRRGHPDEVRIYRRAVRIHGKDHRRKHLPKGRTAPIVV